jgi:hypothetical protein
MEKIKIKAREAEISIEEIETTQVEADLRQVEEVIEIHAEVVEADSREVEEVIEIQDEVIVMVVEDLMIVVIAPEIVTKFMIMRGY